MKTVWNDRQGSRGRQAHCALVTSDGNVHTFTGSAIPGVCHAVESAREKNGKWSNSTWEITHAETTSVVQWMDDWGTGYRYPQSSWDTGYLWMAEKVPMLTREGFEAHIRATHPRTATRWDETRDAEEEFGFSATPDEIAAIRAAQERIADEKSAYEAAEADRRANSPFAALAALRSKS